MSDPRFEAEAGEVPFTGNEVLLKGGLESGMALLTGYPGSPVSDVFDVVFENRELLKEHGVLGQMANNEALAAARLNGVRLTNLRAVAVMKSVGMHVAADGLAIGNLTEPNHPEGGCLVVVGDDSWNETTQINSDSRFLSQHLQMPILEPSTFQEIKDWMDHGFEISGRCNLYVAYILTTNQADGGGTVQVRKNRYPSVNINEKTELSSAQIPIRDFVMIPPHTSQKEATLKGRFEKALELARIKNLNQVFYRPPARRSALGFITSGASYCYLEHALFEMGLSGRFPILKMGMTHPLDQGLVREFLGGMENVVVIEEKRPFLETQVRAIFQETNQESSLPGSPGATKIYGKNFPLGLPGIPEVRGLNPSILIEKLGNLLLKMDLPEVKNERSRIQAELDLIEETAQRKLAIPVRTPTFCPGCPHRDSASVSLKMKKNLLAKKSEDVLFHGESGCHSMLQFAPNEGLMQNYSGMGLGGGTGAGIDPFIKNKQVVFLGDSTFFHSGMIAVSDSIKNSQNVTYVILDNKTTAMTGHQPTPGNDFDILGRKTLTQKIENVIGGMVGGQDVPVIRANPEKREAYAQLLQQMVLKKGVKIIIADKECGITYQRRLKKEKRAVLREKGFLAKQAFINITPEVCEYCLECTRSTGCPGLTVEETDLGPKIVTDLSSCVSDGACAREKVCPSFEKLVITRKNPQRKKSLEFSQRELPLPKAVSFDQTYAISTFAVGGMGAGVATAVIVRAGVSQGYQVRFVDKKGLAIRNGGVFGHILFSKLKDQVFAPIIPYGKADLVLGIDILETARGMDPGLNMRVSSAARTTAVVNNHKTETVLSLMGLNQFDPKELENSIRASSRSAEYFGLDFSEISQRFFGSKLYVNLLLIGAAYQKGRLPVSLENLLAAIRSSVPKAELEENLSAFNLGRKVVLDQSSYVEGARARKKGYSEIMQEKAAVLSTRIFRGRSLARKYQEMVREAVRWMDLDGPAHTQIALRVYDLIQYGNVGLAEHYLRLVWDTYRKDRKDLGYDATKAVLSNLFKVMAIKDEVYVAHLLTSVEKRKRDMERYGVDESNGDRISYVHLNRPQFNILGFDIEFDLNTKNWMLNIMKYGKVLRKLLPAWHRKEKDFRDWYAGLVRQFNYFEDPAAYRAYVNVLKSPEAVTGYRNIRYPKMEAARAQAQQILSRMGWGGSEPAANLAGKN